jgi:hypothetical protein
MGTLKCVIPGCTTEALRRVLPANPKMVTYLCFDHREGWGLVPDTGPFELNTNTQYQDWLGLVDAAPPDDPIHLISFP